MNDPSARLVLSIGGGGYRLFAAVTALKSVERHLDGDRSKVHEVWGSSGGALLGYAFANGFNLNVIDRLGFQLYHGEVTDLPGLHLRSLAHYGTRRLKNWVMGQAGPPALGAWVEAIDRMHARDAAEGKSRPSDLKLPFYPLVSNPRWRHPVAFAEPHMIPDHCRDILIPCSNTRDATAASMAVPLLFRPLRGLTGFENDIWFDGAIVDENPVMLPFIKWMRDRKVNPEGTPKRLKIMLIILNLRLSESSQLSRFVSLPTSVVATILRRVTDIVDLALDSKTQALIRTLTVLDDIEILTATLTLGRLDFITKGDIPLAIRNGQITESWRMNMYPER